ncbi:outer membrane lipoprotein carrier protein LolA [Niveibacterium sp. SC-1]|uniref:LolA family protein n=1 Tax=Niveibacterium sp. SC-1 TaxID=3135646 RepID=UPI00311E681D
MNRLRYFLFGIVLSCAAAGVCAATLVEQVQKVLEQPAVVSGRFEQTRELKDFPKPVKSQGRFLVSREKGVLWVTEKPFSNSVRLTRSEILQKAGDNVTMRLSADKEPAVRAINGVMFALLAGDVGELEKRFSVSGKVEAGRWSLKLVPRDSALGQVITRIDLSGQRFVETVDMEDGNGDRTHIRMLDSQPADSLGKAEAAQFD